MMTRRMKPSQRPTMQIRQSNADKRKRITHPKTYRGASLRPFFMNPRRTTARAWHETAKSLCPRRIFSDNRATPFDLTNIEL